MSCYISYIGPYIKFPVIHENDKQSFLRNNESENYYEVDYISKKFRYLLSSNKLGFCTDEVDDLLEKEITAEERNEAIGKFKKDTKNFVKNFKDSFNIDLEVKYGAIFYEA